MSEVLSQGLAVSEASGEGSLDSQGPKKDLEPGNDPYVGSLEGFTDEEVQAAVAELEAIGQIVKQYADTRVICERLGGAEMTLGEAVTAIWPPSVKGAMILEGVDSVMAEIQQMLDNRPPEDVEPQEPEAAESEDELTEEGAQESDENQVQEQSQSAVADKKPEKAIVEVQSTNQAEKGSSVEDAGMLPAEALASQNSVEGQQDPEVSTEPANRAAKTSRIADEVGERQQQAKAEAATLPFSSTSVEAAVEAISASEPEINTGTAGEPPELTYTGPAFEPFNAAPFMDQEAASILVLEEYEELTETELTDLSPLIVEDEIIVDETNLSGEISGYEVVTETTGEVVDYQKEKEDLFDTSKEVELISEYPSKAEMATENNLESEEEEVTTPPIEEADVSEWLQASEPEEIVETILSIEEVADSPWQLLTRQIELSEPGVSELANEVLGKIIEVQDGLETEENGTSGIIDEDEVRQKLGQLFIELHDILGIDYTPETIEGMVRSIINRDAADEIKKRDSQNGTDESPHDIGTHEVIKQMLISSGSNKKSLPIGIGKSAILLYNFSPAHLSLQRRIA